MKSINIKQLFSEDYISRRAGERLRQMILLAIEGEERLELDFTGLIIASTSFFDESIVKLKLEGWPLSKIYAQLSFKNLNANDKKLLETLLKL